MLSNWQMGPLHDVFSFPQGTCMYSLSIWYTNPFFPFTVSTDILLPTQSDTSFLIRRSVTWIGKTLMANTTYNTRWCVLNDRLACLPNDISSRPDSINVRHVKALGVNPLHSSFPREHKYILTFNVIPPHWNYTGSWNPSAIKTRTYLFYIINIMGADVLATQWGRASTTIIYSLCWTELIWFPYVKD